jgi:hypothetical protein
VGRLRPEVPAELAAVIAQCLERDLARRVQNLGELALRLAPFANREDGVSVERIVRVSGIPAAPPAASPAASTVGPPDARQAAAGSASQSSRDRRVETEPPWHRSASQGYRVPRTGPAAVIAAGVAAFAAVGAIAVFVLRAPPRRAEPPASAATAPSPVASAAAPASAPPVSAPARPTAEPTASVAAAAGSATTAQAALRGAASTAHPSPARQPAPRVAIGATPTANPAPSPARTAAKGTTDPLGIQPE